jgi:hypothetical protein
MSENHDRGRLERLGDEIREWWRSSPSVELRHASLIAIGKRYESLSSLEAWDNPKSKWAFVPPQKRSSPPIELGTFRRSANHKEIDYCFYGNLTTVEWGRFKDWARQATTAASYVLGKYMARIGPIPADHNGWMRLCFRMAWEFPERVDFLIESGIHIEPPFLPEWIVESPDGRKYLQTRHRDADPFASWQALEAYERGELTLQVGRHSAFLSRDIRVCSANAIDALLALGDPPERPAWDKERRELRFGNIICRKYDRSSTRQIPVLEKFENQSWPRSVLSPWSDLEKSKQAIKDINKGLEKNSPIKFGVEGDRLVWFKTDESD